MEMFGWYLMTSVFACCAYAAVDVEKTVAQVQDILKQNVQLPRLSRDEIIQLLNDIRAEDAKSKSSSQSQENNSIAPSQESDSDNEIDTATNLPNNIIKEASDEKINSSQSKVIEEEITTKRNEPTLMVVLPYTPRDGSSLQELYTRPPRIEMVPVTESSLSKKQKGQTKYIQSSKLLHTAGQKAVQANKHQQLGFSKDIQHFLDYHGLQGQQGQPDHFLLPLEGFKPLPPVRPLDGSIELPENILLTYDLIAPNSDIKSNNNHEAGSSNNNFLYEPLRAELPYELETASSESKKTVIPLDLPKSRQTKAAGNQKFEPIDYDSVKVIPLQKGVSPVLDSNERAELENDLRKRQTNSTDDGLRITLSLSTNDSINVSAISETESSSSSSDDIAGKDASTPEPPITNAPSAPNDSAAADSDSGPSITDLEESFGGPAPSQPGDEQLPPPRKNGFYWMLDWNSFLEVGDDDKKVNIRFEPKLGDPQMFLPVNVP